MWIPGNSDDGDTRVPVQEAGREVLPAGRYVPLLGLITSNAAIQNGPVLPSIGFAIPATQLQPIFEACTVMRDRPQAATAMLAAMDVPIQTTSKL